MGLVLPTSLALGVGPAIAGPVPSAAATAVAAPAAAALEAVPAPDFSSSFETAEATQPLASTVENDGSGNPIVSKITGSQSKLPGSVLSKLVAVTASSENPTAELAANLADFNSGTKWLARTSTAWVAYQLSAPVVVKKYTLTSANDSLERSPKNFALQGSTDGVTWVDIDTQVDQTFSNFFVTNTYSFANTTPYAWYRLNITANVSGTLIQLADWDLSDGSATTAASPMVTAVGNGPVSGYNMKANAGYTGLKALRYGGSHVAAGRGYGENRLFNVNIPVQAKTRLSYRIFPELLNDLSYPSTNVAVDLHFTDGTYLNDLGAIDQHDFPLTADGQGKAKILYASQWNQVFSDIGAVAAGKTIDRVLVRYDNAAGMVGTVFQGWLDDVTIDSNPTTVDPASLTNYVDIRRGTNASGSFSRGNNLPISAVPNGFTFFTPVTNATSQGWQYDWQSSNNAANRPTLQGLAISHEPSPWMGDRNQFSVMPSIATGNPSGNAATRALPFVHENEVAQPDYYKVALDNGIVAETAPADHGGILRFTVPAANNIASVVLDTVDNNGKYTVNLVDGTFTGWVDNGSGNSAGRSRMYVYGAFDAIPTKSGIATGGRTGTTYVTFDSTTAKTITLRLATSFLSVAQAQHNAELELTGQTFEQVRTAAQAAWNARLGVITTEGGTETQLKTLYSNLYRLNLFPNSQFENTGSAAAPTYFYASPVSAKVGTATDTVSNANKVAGKIYVNNGFWDTYRTVWPAYSLLYPTVAAEIADGFVQQYRDGGWIARWSSPGYADLMTGTSSDVALADAYLKGVKLPDPLSTYDAAVKNANTVSGVSAVGRKGLASSVFLGYTPTSTGESVSWALEGFINDYGIGNMAAALAVDPATPDARRQTLKEESAYYLSRSKDYVNLFNPDTGFFQGRSASGAFTPNAASFDPEVWGGTYTETNGWNFAFHAPQDGAGLATLYGGKTGLEQKLDTFFSTPEQALKPGGYGGTIHEMLEARDVRMGQFGMSNQVSHHIPYMYNYAGAPAKSAAAAREIMQRLYTGGEIGQGYPGDEDNGEMSAWYILSSLGVYPLQMGAPAYTIGSPLFKKATVHLPTGNLVINAPNNSAANKYVQSVAVNGADHHQNWLAQTDLAAGNILDFVMGASPSSWGTADADLPTSLTAAGEAPATMVDVTGADQGTPTGPAGADVAKLFDDTSATQVTITGTTAQIGWTFTGNKQKPTFYTITSGANPGDPTAWTLEGSNDGAAWTTLDTRVGEVFANRTQTRPFQIANPDKYQQYRLNITAGAGAANLNLAEIELLAGVDQSAGQPIAVSPVAALSGAANIELNTKVASFNGGVGKKSADYTATVDWGDGTPVAAGVVALGKAGNYTVTAKHTYSSIGWRIATVTVTDGATSGSGTVGVDIGFAPSTALTQAFNRTCISDDGTAASCDAKTWSFSRQALAAAGVSQGKSTTVPGTDLKFTLPVVAAGAPDNVIGGGETIALTLPADATKISLIGTGTQGNQDTMGAVNFTDGSNAPLAMQFTDWTQGANPNATPLYGNIVVAKSAYRLNGGGQDSAIPFIFSTAPYTIPAGKTVASLTLPTQTGAETSAGRIHLFAVADNGSAFVATAGADVSAVAGVAKNVTLGTAAKGVPNTTGDAYQAVVQWGDASAAEAATVTVADGVATFTGSHTYAAAGTYLVHVTSADARGSVSTTLTVTVAEAPQPDAEIVADPKVDVEPGATVTVTGKNFKAGETIALALGTGPVSQKQIARGAKPLDVNDIVVAGNGTFTGTVVVPASAVDGSYAITATGQTSARTATTTITVAAKVVPPVYHPQVTVGTTVEQGASATFNGTGFAIGEEVTVTLLPENTVLGTVTTNGDGVITGGSLTIPSGTSVGSHQLRFDGAVSKTPFTATISVTKPALKASTTTAVASPNPVAAGTQAKVTVTVAGAAGQPVPTGTIWVAEGAVVLGSLTLTNGSAELLLPADLKAGSHALTAGYSGDEVYQTSTGAVALDVRFADVPAANQFAGDIQWLLDQGITTGYADGTFHPGEKISRQAMVAFLYRVSHPGVADPTCTVKPYTDVPVAGPLCGTVAWAKAEGITTGYPDGSFHPADLVSRAVLITFLYRVSHPGAADPTCTVKPFTDVAVGDPFCGTIAWAKSSGVSKGYDDGTFHPQFNVDRQATAAFLHRWKTMN